MPRPRSVRDLDPERVRRAVKSVSGSSLDTRGQNAADLSKAAIAARQRAAATGSDHTGLELIERAGRVFDRAKQLQKAADRPSVRAKRRAKLSRGADDALLTAALQIRLAAGVPLDRGYLHALSLEQIQNVKAEVERLAGVDLGALAVDTHRRIQEQRNRVRAERGAG